MNHFVSTGDFTRADLTRLLESARSLRHRAPRTDLAGKSVGLVFFNPSLRTRVSMEIAVTSLGGHAVAMDVGANVWPMEWLEGLRMEGAAAEHVKDAANVLSKYCDAIAIRSFPDGKDWKEDRLDPVLRAFVKHAKVPVINMESALWHPLQALADILTVADEVKGDPAGHKITLTWCTHPKALPLAVPNSLALAATQFGMDLTIACPVEYELPEEVMSTLNANVKSGGGSVRVVHDQDAGVEGAEFVYAKSWGSLRTYGRASEGMRDRTRYRDWRVTEERMARTANGRFMHCLPIRRNVVADDAVIDSPTALVYTQAANRLVVQKAVLLKLLGNTK
ncbi:MAG: N-acetylornithine carbamoyltransferase [Planctomycetes bacterium]|nr:N-acetylornithine carbamoyltransferase [Planctomycetota bacterium]